MPNPTLHLSRSNSKIGSCLNLSLPPSSTCIGRRCYSACYARKGHCYEGGAAWRAWEENYRLWKLDPLMFEETLRASLSRTKTKRFRWHVGGDIPDLAYWRMMIRIAEEFPNIKFATYTKTWYDRPWMLDAAQSPTPPNLKVWLSIWPSLRYFEPLYTPPAYAGTFWTVEPGERPPKGAKKCPGSCSTCQLCWTAKRGSRIWIARH